jgi:hypothetical protein
MSKALDHHPAVKRQLTFVNTEVLRSKPCKPPIPDGSCLGVSSTTHEIEFEVPSMGSYTWRVWAIFPDGLRSPASEWRTVTYIVESA